jgi:hypothetical protein
VVDVEPPLDPLDPPSEPPLDPLGSELLPLEPLVELTVVVPEPKASSELPLDVGDEPLPASVREPPS